LIRVLFFGIGSREVAKQVPIFLLFTSLLLASSLLVGLLGNLLADVLRRISSTLADSTTILCKPSEELLKL
jgi:hypothetical protein